MRLSSLRLWPRFAAVTGRAGVSDLPASDRANVQCSWLSRPEGRRAVTSPSPDGTISFRPCPYHVDGSLGTGRDAVFLTGAGFRPDQSTGAVEEVQAAVGTNRAAQTARMAAVLAHRRNPLLGHFHSHSAHRRAHDCRSASRLHRNDITFRDLAQGTHRRGHPDGSGWL